MRGLWLLVHVLGFTLWLGGGIATMVAGVTAKRMGTAERLAAYKIIGAVQRILVAPGAIPVGLSGFILARPYMEAGRGAGGGGVPMGGGVLRGTRALALRGATAAPPGPPPAAARRR